MFWGFKNSLIAGLVGLAAAGRDAGEEDIGDGCWMLLSALLPSQPPA